MNKTEKKVTEYIKKNNLIPHNTTTIYVATSGGADSMALLEFFHRNTQLTIVAVHVNHGIRGESADKDEHYVAQYCKEHDIKYIGYNAVKANVDIPTNPSEEWARNLRYNFFNSLDMNNALLATAHTASDQAETVLFRMTRGCGLKGMTGIPNKRNYIIRPFLCITRTDTEKLAEMYNINYRTDETNLTDDYSRNNIRHNVMPTLKKINTRAENNIECLCRRVTDIEDYMSGTAKSLIDSGAVYYKNNPNYFSTPALAKLHPAVLSFVILQFFEKYTVDETIVDKLQYAIQSFEPCNKETILYSSQINEKQTVSLTTKTLSIQERPAIKTVQPNKALTIGNTGKRFALIKVTYDDFIKATQNNKQALAYYIDGDRFPVGDMIVDVKKDGDVFKPACKSKNKVVTRLTQFTLDERTNIPLIRDKYGNIIYLYGTGCTDGMLPAETTKTIYQIKEGDLYE